MKWIKYKQFIGKNNIGTEEEPILEDIFQDMGIEYSEANEESVKKIAYNGEYTIEDDGIEIISEPTWQDRIEAQVTYTAIVTDSLLLEKEEEI